MFLNRIKLFIACILICSCGSGQDQEVTIKGRTAVFDSRKNIIHFRLDTSWKEILLKGDKNKSYGGLILNNTRDSFLVVEYTEERPGRIIEERIIEFNLSGDREDTVFNCKANELVNDICLSKNDNRLLFTMITQYFNPSDPRGQLNRPVSILIMDFKKRKTIRKLDTVGTQLNVWINDAPWLSDETKFIYDFRTDRQIKKYNDTSIEKTTRQTGIYLYDINLDKHSLLIPEGYSGEVSPVEDKIAYLKDKGIYVYNINTKSNELLYTLSNQEKTAFVKWTPNGEYIYFETGSVYTSAPVGAFLIRISDKLKMRTDWIKVFY